MRLLTRSFNRSTAEDPGRSTWARPGVRRVRNIFWKRREADCSPITFLWQKPGGKGASPEEQLTAHTPVDELDVHEHPRVIFRVGENTWLEAIVGYLVAPREAGRIKTRLIKKLLAALNAVPDRVMFPAGANR